MIEEIETSPRSRRIIEAMEAMKSERLRDRAFVAYVKGMEAHLDNEELIERTCGHRYVGAGVWRAPDGTLSTGPDILAAEIHSYLEEQC
jgi:hypothetical protein